MKWKITSNGIVLDEKDNMVCTLPDNADPFYKALIRYAPEMFDEMMDLTQSLDSTKTILRKPKKHYNSLERLLELIKEYGR
jgi:hypothetical protein